MSRHAFDGQSYYCKVCGMGFAEFITCKKVDCKLEPTKDAQARKAAADAAKEKRDANRHGDGLSRV